MVESGTNTEPANSRRAVRMSEARRTGTSAPGGASSSSIGMRPAGCSMTTRAVGPAGSGPANSCGEAARHNAGGGETDRTGGGDRAVAGVRGEVADGDGAAGSGCGHQHRLGDDALGDVAHAHQRAGLAADRLQAGEEVAVGVELGRALVAGLAEIAGAHQHHRHRHVDAGGLEPAIRSRASAGRQQAAGLGAGGVEEAEQDRGGGAGHAVDGGVHPRRSPCRPASGRWPRSACRY